MLTSCIHDRPCAFRCKLAGSLAGEDVAKFEQCWRIASPAIAGRAFVVDNSGLRPLGDAGREPLYQWQRRPPNFWQNLYRRVRS
jgi:hypothetical protein